MLELIVLGQIPGTNFVLTFPWVITGLFLGGVFLATKYRHKQHNVKPSIEDITL